MNNINFKFLMKTAFLFVIVVMFNSGCSITDPSDDFKVQIQLPEPGVGVQGQIFDATTNQIATGSFTISIDGEHSDKVVDFLNEPVSAINTDIGMFVFALNDTVQPNADNPVNLVFNVTGAGYHSKFYSFSIRNDNRTHSVAISMTSISNPPPGVVTHEDESGETDDSGAVTTPVDFSTPPEANSGAAASVGVSAGTVITDADGNPLQGQLKASTTFFNNSSPGAMNALPGGAEGISVRGSDGELYENQQLSPGAAIDLVITDGNGKKAKSFSQPIEMELEMGPNTFNAAEGRNIQNGDVLAIYSFDEEQGIMVFEGDADITGPLPNGQFAATIYADHLSTWVVGAAVPPGCFFYQMRINRPGYPYGQGEQSP